MLPSSKRFIKVVLHFNNVFVIIFTVKHYLSFYKFIFTVQYLYFVFDNSLTYNTIKLTALALMDCILFITLCLSIKFHSFKCYIIEYV